MLEIGTYVHDLKSYFHSIQFYHSQIIYTVIHLYVDSTNKNLNLIHPHKMVENLKDISTLIFSVLILLNFMILPVYLGRFGQKFAHSHCYFSKIGN